jgi:hypothetical protein
LLAVGLALWVVNLAVGGRVEGEADPVPVPQPQPQP